MADEKAKFATLASPVAWLETAGELHEQAISLVKPLGALNGFYDGRQMIWFPAYNRAAFLLGGFALENLLKAFLVYENPQWISNGRLARNLRSHALTYLQAQSNLVPHKKRFVWVLQEFEHGLESWSRYPCSLTASDTDSAGHMTPELWDGYLKLTGAYGNRLRKMLSTPWNGPHGITGRVVFRGEAGTMGRQGFKRLRSPEVRTAKDSA